MLPLAKRAKQGKEGSAVVEEGSVVYLQFGTESSLGRQLQQMDLQPAMTSTTKRKVWAALCSYVWAPIQYTTARSPTRLTQRRRSMSK